MENLSKQNKIFLSFGLMLCTVQESDAVKPSEDALQFQTRDGGPDHSCNSDGPAAIFLPKWLRA